MSKRILFSGMAALFAASVLVVPARADFIPVLDTVPPNAPAGGVFNYDLDFNVTTDTGTGMPAERLVAGNYIYITGASDITGATIIPAYAADLTVSSFDATTVLITYTGPTTTTATSFKDALVLTSTDTGVALGNFTGTTIKNSGAADGTLLTTTGKVGVPAPVPEPSSIVLSVIGLGICTIGYARRRMAGA